MQEHGLTGLQRSEHEQVRPDSARDLRERGGGDEVDARRQRHELTSWYVDPLGVAAPSEQGADLIADGPVRHAVADLEHASRALQAQMGGRTRRRVVVALSLEEVGPVDGRGDDLDDDVTG